LYKEICETNDCILTSFNKKKTNSIDINNDASLNLLKTKALNADFNVDTLVDQKFIKKKEVKPINSQPKNKTKKLPLVTKHIILITKQFIKRINLSTLGSYLKYEKVYIYTNTAIVNVKNIKL
jgi:hypothetical protein